MLKIICLSIYLVSLHYIFKEHDDYDESGRINSLADVEPD